LICPTCGRENPAGGEFCLSCGSDIRPRKSVRKCDKCGSTNPGHVIYCGTCGADLPPAVDVVDDEALADRKAGGDSVSEAPSIPASWICKWCKRRVGPYVKVCPNCMRDMVTGVFVGRDAASVYDNRGWETIESRHESAGPTIGGILLILAGVAALGQGALYLFTQSLANQLDVPGVSIGCCGAYDVLLGLGALLGGVVALDRRNFVLVVLGSIAAIASLALLFVGPILGIIALILFAAGKDEFD